MKLGQRIVGVLALAVILLLVGACLSAQVRFALHGYAPLTSSPPTVARDGLSPFANLFVWFGLVLGWFAGSFLILRSTVHRHLTAPEIGAES